MPETLRKRISQAAQKLFLEEGLEGVSMRKVAKMAGVSAPAIYRHYENKDDLLREIIDHGLQILETYLEPALNEPTPLERLNRLADRFLDFAIEQPKYFEFAFMIPSRSISDVRTELAEKNWVTFNLACGGRRGDRPAESEARCGRARSRPAATRAQAARPTHRPGTAPCDDSPPRGSRCPRW